METESPTTQTSAFLEAAWGRPATHTPVWFMRQAGRSLPEYRAVRGKGSILEAIKQPELAAEITLQPIRRYGVDAAVLYSDIVVPAHAVGFGIDVAPGTGPVADEPFRSRADLDRLRPLARDDIGYVTSTVELLVDELPAAVPVLAFAGAPFTVASYLVEGRPSRDYRHTKALIHSDQTLWHDLMDRLASSAIEFIDAQLASGAGAFQLFDSWAGALDRREYERSVLPHSRRVFAELSERHPGAPASTSAWVATTSSSRCSRPVLRCSVSTGAPRSPTPAPGSATTSSCREISIQRSCSPGRMRRSRGHDRCCATTSCRTAHGIQGTSSTSVTGAARCRSGCARRRRRPRPRDHRAMSGRVGVVLMSYGTPASPDDIEGYYTDIRRGRPPTAEALGDLVRRYGAIGGISPLAAITEAQRVRISEALDALEPGRYDVRLGFKHTDPKVEATAAGFVADGFREVVGLVLAPHYSSASIGGYVAQLEAGAGPQARAVESWAVEPEFVRFLADDLRTRIASMTERVGDADRVRVLFTAHSLPQRVIDGGDPYVDELRATAEAVAGAAGIASDRWQIAWQSAGRTPEPWIGPDILGVLDELGAADGVDGVIVCACGFVADHLEVLYDLDIEAADRATANGLVFDRTASVADDEVVMSALARRVHDLTAR